MTTTERTKYKPVDSPLKWHGGKSYLAKKIVVLFPPKCKNPNNPDKDDPGYLHYVEPFAGGLSVLLANDPKGVSEVVNDKHGPLTNFWQILKSPYYFRFFEQSVQATPFSDKHWNDAAKRLSNHLGMDYPCWEMAADFFVVCRQSLAGRMDAFAPRSRSRTRQGMNEQVAAWLSCVDGLPQVHARLKRVLILNGDALEVIRKEDGPRTLFYLDPPYLHSTRTTTGEYEHEMDTESHAKLLDTLKQLKGRFLLSGYHSDLYDRWAAEGDYRCYEFDISNNAAGGKEKRRMVECVWSNY